MVSVLRPGMCGEPAVGDLSAEAVNQRAEESLHAKRAEDLLRLQRDVAVGVGSAKDFDEALRRLLDGILLLEGIDVGAIYLLDAQTDWFRLVCSKGASEEFFAKVSCYQVHGSVPRGSADDTDAESVEGRRVGFKRSSPPARSLTAGRPAYGVIDDGTEIVRETCRAEGMTSIGVIPVYDEGRVLGSIHVGTRRPEPIPLWSRHVMEAIAAQIGGVIAGLRAKETIQRERESLRRLLDLHDRDRKMLAYEIHDGLAQELTGALLSLQALECQAGVTSPQARLLLDRAMGLVRQGITQTRRLIGGLRPPVLDESGMGVAIEYLICEIHEQGGPAIEFEQELGDRRPASPLENVVFRIVQESLTNACRHSRSPKIRVRLTQREGRIQIEIQDWGIGFDPARVEQGHFGLQGIRQRALLFGGSAIIESTLGTGTRILVELPFIPVGQ